MANDEMEQFWTEWLEKYKSFKCLWDPAAKSRSCAAEQDLAWDELINMAKKTVYADADSTYVKARLHIFVNRYKLEAKKVSATKMNGVKYEPKSFSYHILKEIFEKRIQNEVGSKDNQTLSHMQNEHIDTDGDDDADMSHSMRPSYISSTLSTQNRNNYVSFWREVIKKWISFKCLWDSKQGRYSKDEKTDALMELLTLIQTRYPDANLDYVKCRLKSFRTVSLRHKKKLIEANAKGRAFTSSLFYFDLMSPMYANRTCFVDDRNESEDSQSVVCADVETLKKETCNLGTKTKLPSKQLYNKRFIYGDLDLKDLSYDKRVWLRFIRKYVTLKCLWDHKNRDDYKEYEREAAWQELLNIAREIDQSFSVSDVKKRLKSFRSVYTRKLKEARREGRSCVKSVYYFNALSPLYQEGFPILDSDMDVEDGGLNVKLDALNPLRSTYEDANDEEQDVVMVTSKKAITAQNKEFWCKFLKKYVSLKCLWLPNEGTHLENIKAYEELLHMTKPYYPEADLAYIKGRIQRFRQRFKRAFNQMQAARESGIAISPKPYYFDTLLPIFQKPDCENSGVNFVSLDVKDMPTFFKECSIEEHEYYNENNIFSDMDTNDTFFQNASVDIEAEEENVLSPQYNVLEESCDYKYLNIIKTTNQIQIPNHKSTSTQTMEYNECQNCGNRESEFNNASRNENVHLRKFIKFENHLTERLENIHSNQFLFIEKLITDVCFYGRLKKLTFRSRVSINKV